MSNLTEPLVSVNSRCNHDMHVTHICACTACHAYAHMLMHAHGILFSLVPTKMEWNECDRDDVASDLVERLEYSLKYVCCSLYIAHATLVWYVQQPFHTMSAL